MMDDLIDRWPPPRSGGEAHPTAPAGPAEAPGSNAPELSVSELSARIRRTIEDAHGFVRVRGELGRVSRPRSGHIYLDLKDDRAVLGAVIWRGVAQRLRIQPTEGLEVVAEGRITTYPGQSKYQMVIETLAPAGAGALMAMLEERKARLAAEGLFDQAKKRAPPFLPKVIGVVTSPSGAVIRDILHRVAERFPRRVLLWPVAVQGEASARQVAAAIRGFAAMPAQGPVPRPDVLIVARGGGSVEDLWGFNDEDVARAAAASPIPLISAVGHETDFTLIDFAADRRAPTPTAAAEMATPVRGELIARLRMAEDRRQAAGRRAVDDRRARLRDLGRGLPRPAALTESARQRLDAAADRLPRALLAAARAAELRYGRVAARLSPRLLTDRIAAGRDRAALFGARLGPALTRAAVAARERYARGRFDARLALSAERMAERRAERLRELTRLLEGFSYRATLERGFAAVRAEGQVAPRASGLAGGQGVEIEFADGRLAAIIAGAGGGSAAARPKKADRKPDDDDAQGSLL